MEQFNTILLALYVCGSHETLVSCQEMIFFNTFREDLTSDQEFLSIIANCVVLSYLLGCSIHLSIHTDWSDSFDFLLRDC